MSGEYSNDLIALAAVVQAVTLVDKIAFEGEIKDTKCLRASLLSLAKPNSDDLMDIYESPASLKVGLENLEKSLTSIRGDKNFQNKLTYIYKINRIASILSVRADLARQVADAVPAAKSKSKSIDELAEHWAGIYYQCFSSMPQKYRVVVLGRKDFIRLDENVHKIRALLLAGVRAALLWRMHGRGFFDLLLFRRKSMLKEVREITREWR